MHIGKLKRAWEMGQRLQQASGELPISPWDALLTEVRRSAYRSMWLDQRVDDERQREDELRHESEPNAQREQAAELRRWLAESRKERMHMARVAKAAVDAGLAERYVQSIEIEARLIARVLENSIGVLDLTYDQKRAVALKLREELESVSAELQQRHAAVAALPKRS